MRVALFGGTFDPIHTGHLAIAAAAANRFELDEVLFAPAGMQPHKRDSPTATWEQRLAMVKLACGADPRFHASPADAPLPDGRPNYTVETLQTLADTLPRDTELFNLVGADTFQHLAKWREPYRTLELAEWIVVSRPGVPLRIPEGLTLTEAQERRIHLLGEIQEHVAATQLRERLAAGDPCGDLLPEPVRRYLEEHRLYG